MKPTNLNFTSKVLLTCVPPSDGASEAGQVSQPVRAFELGLRDLSKPTARAYFWGVKLMLVGVMNFGQIQKIRLVVVKNFRS